MSDQYHLAQANILYAVDSLKSETLAGFHELALEIDALARKAPGFVFRLESLFDLPEDPYMLNISVWESMESLRDFTYRGDHAESLRMRRTWFKPPRSAPSVLWWLPAGTLPDVNESMARLEMLNAKGPTPEAFTFRRMFQPPVS
ncbi:DUF3291 domain-containing protein [Streptomyces tubercidicus]|uniref:DUF3291 domain-containing protein n=1 Tax=Streptomyces tubercidicus TaxID=47759 RepID=A0A640UI39_9ACTN|nr:DUF3291 domain-containing protein [Streptomyces tubercidicus]WAU10610.1 DUF3291 domain-containing protein [Streptomyces tubercidicus]GFE35733.1 hypothetical protein Stube_04060 [Streptomyces tubercidicus]